MPPSTRLATHSSPLLVGIAARKPLTGASPRAAEIVEPVGPVFPPQRRHRAGNALELAGGHAPGLVAEKQFDALHRHPARALAKCALQHDADRVLDHAAGLKLVGNLP